ncbi:hypothetical protein [Microbacterium capsulatum]|uniref:DUF5134 domain-containing protein n=1 Tax=Microbacterium capsulatum TaxID=3041921 RepID=A0ABU0XHG5_9MICO|nr:hypothetical protein [Microbacterium sp. ASV81]MDQ4214577.1 hypothetical protein [Microbacterium sp. ASV81]
MAPLHETAMWLMIGSAITAAVCCLGAGRLSRGAAVPWQGRQSAVVMAAGMVLLWADGADARIALLVAAAGLCSAMLGAAGIRGRSHAGACFHRAFGCIVMTLCAFASIGAAHPAAGGVAPGVAVGGAHGGHGGAVPAGVLAAAGVLVLLVLMTAERVRHRPAGAAGVRLLLEAEGAAMAISLIAMGVMVVL